MAIDLLAFALPLEDPRAAISMGNTGRVILPFRMASAILAACVPSQRCSGLQQDGLSQEWQTFRRAGSLPELAMKAYLCALEVPHVLGQIIPYPNRSLAPDHSQHIPSSPTFTLFQKSLDDTIQNLN
jgi:hypothetical protein